MAKWADFLISRIEEKEGVISRVLVHKDNDTTVGGGTVYTVAEVIEAMLKQNTFCTIVWNYGTAQWSKGALVGREQRNGQTYIRSYKDGTWNDNLEHLPPV